MSTQTILSLCKDVTAVEEESFIKSSHDSCQDVSSFLLRRQ